MSWNIIDIHPEEHARLGASGAHRWMKCPASVTTFFDGKPPKKPSAAAEEGTAAHKAAELILLGQMSLNWQEARTKFVVQPSGNEYVYDKEMQYHVSIYIDYIRDLIKREDGEAYYERVCHIEDGNELWGLCDGIIFKLGGTTMHIVDLKYGKGIYVPAENNEQGKYYGIGAYERFGGPWVEKVVIHIVQPRHYQWSENNFIELTIEELMEFKQEVLLAEKAVDSPNPAFNPGSKQCLFCPGKGTCDAYSKNSLAPLLANNELVLPDVKNVPEIKALEILEKKQQIINYLNALEEHYQEKALKGDEVPGFKVVRGTKHRQWREDEEIVKKELLNLPDATFDRIYKLPELKTITQLEKEFGADGKKLISKLTVKPEGQLKMVPENAKGEAVLVKTIEETFSNVEVQTK